MELKRPSQTKIVKLDPNIKNNGMKLGVLKSNGHKKETTPEAYLNSRERKKWKRLAAATKERLIQKSLRGKSDSTQSQFLDRSERSLKSRSRDSPNIYTNIDIEGQNRANIFGKRNADTRKGRAAKGGSEATKKVVKTSKDAVKKSAEAGTTAAATAATGGANLPAKAAATAAKKTAKGFKQMLENAQKQTESNIEQMQQRAKERMDQNPMESPSDGMKYIGNALLVAATPVLLIGSVVVFAFATLIMVLLVALISVFMPVLLVLLLVITIFAYYEMAGQTGGQAIVAVAQEELSHSAENIGGDKYKDWYGMNADWCNMFVSWCANECGFLESGIIPRTASVSDSLQFYQSRNQFETKESGYKPKAGDIIIFKTGASHIGIVVGYDPDTDTVITIEGNAGASGTTPYHAGSRVTQCTYPLDHPTITGYGTPAYPADMSLTDSVMDIIRNMFYAVETGGQEYGQARYDDVTAAYANTSNETAITIGAGQWFATEAQQLLNRIRSTVPETFASLDTAGIGTDLDTQDWQYYNVSPDSEKGRCIARIISCPAGKLCQDAMMNEQINEYLQTAKDAGVEGLAAQVMYAEIMHLGGKSAADRILGLAQTPYTAESIYNAVKSGGTGSQVNAPMFRSRHDCIYGWIQQYLIPALNGENAGAAGS